MEKELVALLSIAKRGGAVGIPAWTQMACFLSCIARAAPSPAML